jgi:hypothetical protein
MTELITPTGRVHWLGTGLSTGSGLGLICDGVPSTMLWGRTEAKAEACLDRLGLSGRAVTRALEPGALEAELAAGDLVVSMLPASWHSDILQLALDSEAHFACSSYVSPDMAAQAQTARKAGLVILTESGLDPGIDHLLGHELVRRAAAAIGDRPATARFTSYCGSNPAVANEFRYLFSWAPLGVLTALLTPARYIADGVEKVGERPWEAVEKLTISGEPFEVYPNRDSLPFVATYRFPATWQLETFVRGTLRLDGWSEAWAQVFTRLREEDDDGIAALADDLARRYPNTPADRDRVVMAVALEVSAGDGTTWSGDYVLNAVGDDTESATSRLVTVPLAGGSLEIVGGRTAPGLHQAADASESVRRWLTFLSAQGITAEFRGEQ